MINKVFTEFVLFGNYSIMDRPITESASRWIRRQRAIVGAMPGQPLVLPFPVVFGTGVNKGKPVRAYDLEPVRAAGGGETGARPAPSPAGVGFWGGPGPPGRSVMAYKRRDRARIGRVTVAGPEVKLRYTSAAGRRVKLESLDGT